jgi:hypothetical protein
MDNNIIYTDKKHKCIKGNIYVNKTYIGKKYNNWTLIDFSKISISPSGKTRQIWKAKCDCGVIKEVLVGSIICNKSKSCGCYYKEIKKKDRLPDNIAAVNNKYAAYRNSANKRNIPFELTKKEFDKITQGNCYYCGKEPMKRNFNRKTSSYFHYMNGVDRINNDLGYSITNSVTCCDTCNRAKLDHKLSDFIDWIKKVYNNIDNISIKIKNK